MMRRLVLLLVAIAAVMWLPTASFAAIDNSHHDLKAWAGAGATRVDSCYPCHGYRETGAVNTALGTVGSLCYLRCHSGDSGVAGTINVDGWFPEIGSFSGSAMSTASYSASTVDKYATAHKFVRASIPSPDTTTWLAGAGRASTWPYAGETNIECTTCHDVHANTYTPFIRAPLSDNTTRANAFCHQCHAATADGSARWVDVYNMNPNGSHPSEVGWGAGQGAYFAGSGRLGRTIGYKDTIASDNNAVFRNVSWNGTALNDRTKSYNPGAKLGDFGQAGNVGCYSCHATHLPSGAGLSQLIVAPYQANQASITSQMCVGCHGATNTDGRNPGATSYYHPCNGETRVDDFTTDNTVAKYRVTTPSAFIIAVNVSGIDMGTGGVLICTSCHTDTRAANNFGVHNGPAGSMIINPLRLTCQSCHNVGTVQLGYTPNSHHVYGGGTTRGSVYTTLGYPSGVQNYITGANAKTYTISDGLDCYDCHTFNGTAHNW